MYNLNEYKGFFAHYLRVNRLTPEDYCHASGENLMRVKSVLKGEMRPSKRILDDTGFEEFSRSEYKRVLIEEPFYVEKKNIVKADK